MSNKGTKGYIRFYEKKRSNLISMKIKYHTAFAILNQIGTINYFEAIFIASMNQRSGTVLRNLDMLRCAMSACEFTAILVCK